MKDSFGNGKREGEELHNAGEQGKNGTPEADGDPDFQKKRKLDEENVGGNDVDPDASPSKKPHLDGEVKRLLPDLEKFWSTVEQDPTDFTAWTHLLQYVDQVTYMSVASEAYDAFLQRYPYCYGYWKKFADFAKRRGTSVEVQEIFQRGLLAIPLSVDLWIHYLTYVKSTWPNDIELIRSKFDLGIESCGLEFRSDKFWDQYVQWEMESKNFKNAMKVWDQMIRTPTQAVKKHFEKFVEFVNEHEPSEFLSEAEYSTLVNEASQDPGDGLDDLASKLRAKVIQLRSDIYEITSNEVKIRSTYEEGIKRPYFHVKPVEKNQLKNWTEYLDFEIGKGDLRRIVTLFERCLIACAMYAEYWQKFLQFLQSQSPLNVAKIQEVFIRVTKIHHPKIYKFSLDFAAFEEAQGNLEKASTIYEELISAASAPVLPVYYRQIHFERRRKNIVRCSELFEKYINECGDKSISAYLTIKYARYLNHVMGSYQKAVEVLKSKLDGDLDASTRSRLLLAIVDTGMQASPLDYNLVMFAFDDGISKLEKEEKVAFARRKLEFLEDYSEDIKSVQKADEELQELSKVLKSNEKPEAVSTAVVKISNSEAVKVAPISSDTQAVGYDYDSSSAAYSSQYGQYPQGQYPSNWSSQAPVPSADPSVYGQSYVNQPTSWNSFYA